MKTTNKILLAAATAASLAIVNSTFANDGAFLTPHLQAAQTRDVAGTNQDPDLAHGFALAAGTPHFQGFSSSLAVGSSKNDPDLVAAYRLAIHVGKSPNPAAPQFELAPVK